MTRTCLNCKVDITHRLKIVKYCSDECRMKAFYQKKKSEVIVR